MTPPIFTTSGACRQAERHLPEGEEVKQYFDLGKRILRFSKFRDGNSIFERSVWVFTRSRPDSDILGTSLPIEDPDAINHHAVIGRRGGSRLSAKRLAQHDQSLTRPQLQELQFSSLYFLCLGQLSYFEPCGSIQATPVVTLTSNRSAAGEF